jgi:hypothetical protein
MTPLEKVHLLSQELAVARHRWEHAVERAAASESLRAIAAQTDVSVETIRKVIRQKRL